MSLQVRTHRHTLSFSHTHTNAHSHKPAHIYTHCQTRAHLARAPPSRSPWRCNSPLRFTGLSTFQRCQPKRSRSRRRPCSARWWSQRQARSGISPYQGIENKREMFRSRWARTSASAASLTQAQRGSSLWTTSRSTANSWSVLC